MLGKPIHTKPYPHYLVVTLSAIRELDERVHHMPRSTGVSGDTFVGEAEEMCARGAL